MLITGETQMEILYCDDRVIVCVKPAGVLSTDEPGGMPDRLRLALGDGAVKSVHRLDRAVGGVMVFARTKRAAAELSAQIASGTFQKEYRTVVHGVPEPDSGSLRDHLHRDRAKRMTLVVPADTPQSQEAVLDYRLLRTEGELSLLSLLLHTGRTHQIRVQFASRKLPLLGDGRYGGKSDKCDIALWSAEISFISPFNGQEMTFSAPFPQQYPWNLFHI